MATTSLDQYAHPISSFPMSCPSLTIIQHKFSRNDPLASPKRSSASRPWTFLFFWALALHDPNVAAPEWQVDPQSPIRAWHVLDWKARVLDLDTNQNYLRKFRLKLECSEEIHDNLWATVKKMTLKGYLYKVKKSTQTHDVPQTSKPEEFVGSPKTRQTMEECGLIYLELHNTHQACLGIQCKQISAGSDIKIDYYVFVAHVWLRMEFPLWTNPFHGKNNLPGHQ